MNKVVTTLSGCHAQKEDYEKSATSGAKFILRRRMSTRCYLGVMFDERVNFVRFDFARMTRPKEGIMQEVVLWNGEQSYCNSTFSSRQTIGKRIVLIVYWLYLQG